TRGHATCARLRRVGVGTAASRAADSRTHQRLFRLSRGRAPQDPPGPGARPAPSAPAVRGPTIASRRGRGRFAGIGSGGRWPAAGAAGPRPQPARGPRAVTLAGGKGIARAPESCHIPRMKRGVRRPSIRSELLRSLLMGIAAVAIIGVAGAVYVLNRD